MNFAGELTKAPGPPCQKVVGTFGYHRQRQNQITNGQVDDEAVGWSTQLAEFREDAQHGDVAEKRQESLRNANLFCQL